MSFQKIAIKAVNPIGTDFLFANIIDRSIKAEFLGAVLTAIEETMGKFRKFSGRNKISMDIHSSYKSCMEWMLDWEGVSPDKENEEVFGGNHNTDVVNINSDHVLTYFYCKLCKPEIVYILDNHVDAGPSVLDKSSFINYIDAEQIIIMGVSDDYSNYEKSEIITDPQTRDKTKYFTLSEIRGMGISEFAAGLITDNCDKRSWLSVDLDVMDKKEYFGFHYNKFLPLRLLSEKKPDYELIKTIFNLGDDGLRRAEIINLCNELKKCNIIGADITEYSPLFDINGKTYKLIQDLRCILND